MNGDVRRDSRDGIASGLGAYLLWGALTAYWKLLDEFDAFDLIGWRIVTAMILLLVLVAAQKRLRVVAGALRDTRLLSRIISAAVLLVVNWTLYVWAVVNEHVIETALGYFIAPLFTAMIGVFVLREPLRLLQKIALGFALASVIVLTVAYGRPPVVALAIAASWAFYGLLKKQVPLRPVDSLTAETTVLTLPALVFVGWSLTRSTPVFAESSALDVALVLLTGLITAVPLLLFAHAALRLPLTVIGPMQYIVPVVNFLLGWIVYNEDMQPERFVGFVLVWIGLACTFADTIRNSDNRAARANDEAAAARGS
ncbi:MAG: EamA family transporter RarD [Actinobacteria bacterium]|nr:EamA family transporter RarD [Actinomycetota bacterium]